MAVESGTDKNITQSRSDYRRGVFTLLRSRGVDPDVLMDKTRSVTVVLHFDEYSRQRIPSEVQEFVASVYPGREVAINKLEAYYDNYDILDGFGNQISIEETMAATIRTFPRDPASFERDYRASELTGIVIPGEENVRSTSIGLGISFDPMNYGILSYPVLDWMMGGEYPKFEQSTQPLDPTIVSVIGKMIPDLPKGKDMDILPRGRTLLSSGDNIFRQLYQIFREETAARIKLPIPQPHREILIDHPWFD